MSFDLSVVNVTDKEEDQNWENDASAKECEYGALTL